MTARIHTCCWDRLGIWWLKRLVRGIAVLALLPIHLLAGGEASEADGRNTFWVVSTRGISSSEVKPGVSGAITYLKGDSQGCLSENTSTELLQEVSSRCRVVIYVPGNRSDFASAHNEGWKLFLTLNQPTGSKGFVFVVWSWPSDRISLAQRPDIWAKACRADLEGLILGEWLGQLPGGTQVVLVSYSLGARAVVAALHVRGGGQLCGGEFSFPTPKGLTSIRVLLVGAAIDAHSLGPSGAYSRALAESEQFVITTHRRDVLLRMYPLLYGLGGPPALGFVGPTSLPADQLEKVELLPVEAFAGSGHGWENYFSAFPVQARLERMVLAD